MNDKNPDIGSKDAHRLFLEYLQKQINLVDLAFKGSREIDDERASYLEALFLQLIDDAKSTYLVCQNGFANQGYILVRALLERAINYCYLQICDEDEFNNFITYSKQKSVRSLNRRLGENNHSVELKFSGEINFDSNPELKQALDKFTSESGKEKTRWTQTSLPDRAIMVEKHCNNIWFTFPIINYLHRCV